MISRDIAASLSNHHSVVVLCPRPSRPERYQFKNIDQPENYKVIRLNSFVSPASKIISRLRESYSFGKHCVDYIKKHQKDIDCIYLNSWPLASQYLIIKAAKKFDIPSVIHIQDIYPESLTGKLSKAIGRILNKFLLPVDRFILKNATRILGISENMISCLSDTRKVERSKFEMIRNWQNDEQFLNFAGEKKHESLFIFMYAGSISASAGVDALIYAFDKANIRNSQLVIAGDGAEKDNCMEVARKLNNRHIEFVEAVPERIAEIQSGADVLLLPLKKGISKTATPSKLTAYLFSGKPVIACVETGSDVANILNETGCGLVVEPENIDAIAYAMESIWNMEKNQLREMGKRGRNYAILHLSKKANLSKVIAVIEDNLPWK